MKAQQQLTRIRRGWLKPKQRKAAGIDPDRICCTCRYGDISSYEFHVKRYWICTETFLSTKAKATCLNWEKRI